MVLQYATRLRLSACLCCSDFGFPANAFEIFRLVSSDIFLLVRFMVLYIIIFINIGRLGKHSKYNKLVSQFLVKIIEFAQQMECRVPPSLYRQDCKRGYIKAGLRIVLPVSPLHSKSHQKCY